MGNQIGPRQFEFPPKSPVVDSPGWIAVNWGRRESVPQDTGVDPLVFGFKFPPTAIRFEQVVIGVC